MTTAIKPAPPHLRWVSTGWLLRNIPNLTYRQLDWWTRKGYVHPLHRDCPGSGHFRAYPVEEYPIIQMMAALVEAGVRPSNAARAARCGGWLTPRVRAVLDPDAAAL